VIDLWGANAMNVKIARLKFFFRTVINELDSRNLVKYEEQSKVHIAIFYSFSAQNNPVFCP
jgi:hypothetical protein